MSRVCDLTGKRYMSGNNVSHANNRTRRKFNINLRSVVLESEALNEKFRLKIAASTMRTISKNGGFDKFIIKSNDTKLSETALKIKRKIKKILSPHK
jgi:large subunit ribosomal protein L28